MTLRLDSDIQYVKGVGPKRARLLHAREIHTVEDALLRFPRRYEDRGRVCSIGEVRLGDTVTLRAKVQRLRLIRTRSRGAILDVLLSDGSSFIHAKWFNAAHLYRNNVFSAGAEVVLTGRAGPDKYDEGLVIFNPEFEIVSGEGEDDDLAGHTPVYEEVAGITSRQFRRIVCAALDAVGIEKDPLPAELRQRRDLPGLRDSFEAIHRPALSESIDRLNTRRTQAHRRFILEEFLLFELTLSLRRHRLRTSDGPRIGTDSRIRERLKSILPFHPTDAQKRAFREIVEDLAAPHPMSRLLQGDVGCGKTIVAFEAIVLAVENGFQAALMAPTEILAEQHAIRAAHVLGPLGYRIAQLKKGASREAAGVLEGIRNGEFQVAVGTHALLEERARFHRLGLVVIDEQHRFGVLQRLRLMEKGASPNTLVMTATPIPRTLAMTFYGDLDVSTIDEMPPGRTPIRTFHVFERERPRIEAEIRQELDLGRQCYVVYPLIDESEKLDLRSAREGYERFGRIFGRDRVALLHGRMKAEEKEAVMGAFASGELGVLVATTVVEVGVDVPNATFMLIEHAERFGIAQLHQLRGRVGRGPHASRCVLMTPRSIGDLARQRIRAVQETSDGFRLAEADLRLRGPGELAGTRQSGVPEFQIASLVDDFDILAEARDEAERWVQSGPDRDRLIADLSRRRSAAGLARVG